MKEEMQSKIESAAEHYRRLIGMGYDRKDALRKVSESFRDILRKKRQQQENQTAPTHQNLHSGEEHYDNMLTNSDPNRTAPQSTQPEAPTPVLGQKIVANRDIGQIVWVGSRFVSVKWLKNGSTQRIGLRRFDEAVKAKHYVLLPKIRVANFGKKTHDDYESPTQLIQVLEQFGYEPSIEDSPTGTPGHTVVKYTDAYGNSVIPQEGKMQSFFIYRSPDGNIQRFTNLSGLKNFLSRLHGRGNINE